MKRKISAAMATQHPDHAGKPYWHTQPFISTQFESEEAYLAYSELGIGEYKWDWEGKLVDESVLERLFSSHFDFYKKNPLGVKTFLTFRLPNPKVQTEFRIGRAFMNLASAASEARHFKLPSPPLFEVILPMTKTAEDMLSLQVAYEQMHKLKHPLYRLENILTNLRIIPLFEEVEVIMNADKILDKYLTIYKNRFKKLPPYMRPYLARSDPALNSGLVPTVLAIKIGLSRIQKLSEKRNIPLYPIIGAAALIFRGGITPLTISKFADEYKGVRTTTIQSAFRYDYDKKDVIKAIKQLEKVFPKGKPVIIPKTDEEEIRSLIPLFEKNYKEVIENIAPVINKVASNFPERRERVQHTGLFGYSRGVGKVKLPRAISFTGALYSLGIPPEIIGTGRSLKKAKEMGKLNLVKKYYKYLEQDLESVSHFVNLKNLQKLGKKSNAWKKVLEDVEALKELFDISFKPKTKEEIKHLALTSKILESLEANKSLTILIEQAALQRKSLG